jgi:CRP/FNR family transcriptional regulator, cyclic AMP receptor protein
MIVPTPKEDRFNSKIRSLFQNGSPDCRVLKIARHEHVYTAGDRQSMIYFVETGQVKVLLHSPEGKDCLLAIHGAGDIFGELCLHGQDLCIETAEAMQDSTLRQMSSRSFMIRMGRDSMMEDFVQFLVARIVEQQKTISALLTVNSEQRLARTLLQLAEKLGHDLPRSRRIEGRIFYQELAEMVGTTRTRVGLFMKRFRELGLIEVNRDHSLVIKEARLAEHIGRFGIFAETPARGPLFAGSAKAADLRDVDRMTGERASA